MSGYLSACASEVLISRAQEILGWEGEKGKAGSQGQPTFFLLALMGHQEGMESSLRVFFLGVQPHLQLQSRKDLLLHELLSSSD